MFPNFSLIVRKSDKIWHGWLKSERPLIIGKTFKELKFPFAPLNEQKEIVDLLNLLNEQTLLGVKHQLNKIKHLDELKQSVLQEAFNGNL